MNAHLSFALIVVTESGPTTKPTINQGRHTEKMGQNERTEELRRESQPRACQKTPHAHTACGVSGASALAGVADQLKRSQGGGWMQVRPPKGMVTRNPS